MGEARIAAHDEYSADVIGYDDVIDALRRMSGNRVAVRIEATEPSASVASIVGVLAAEDPQTSLEAGDLEEGVVFTVNTGQEHPESTFSVWRNAEGVGRLDEDSAAWRVGPVVVVVELMPDAYGYPPV